MSERATVGLVVVSHSRALATAALALAAEMLHDRPVAIEVAAGLDETSFGTDAVAVKQAIEAADGPAGVVVLMDLGSAVLSAELALELLEDADVRERVTLSSAPFVEGLVAAAVAAAGGAGRDEVAAEAAGALQGKALQLGVEEPPVPGEALPAEASGTFTVSNAHGIHARPAARLVAEVAELDATVTLTNLTTGAGPVPGDSMMWVSTLGAERGHEVRIDASGTGAQGAVDRLLRLAEQGFGE